jgi:hypothetical protein
MSFPRPPFFEVSDFTDCARVARATLLSGAARE